MPAGILIGIALNLQISLGSTAILTILSLSIHEHETFFDLLRSSLISFCNMGTSFTHLLLNSNYFILFDAIVNGVIF